MPNKYNVYGTVCTNCGKILEPDKKSNLEIEVDNRHRLLQMQVREYFRRIILGDTDGNKVE